jgi:hypothetical protein
MHPVALAESLRILADHLLDPVITEDGDTILIVAREDAEGEQQAGSRAPWLASAAGSPVLDARVSVRIDRAMSYLRRLDQAITIATPSGSAFAGVSPQITFRMTLELWDINEATIDLPPLLESLAPAP